MNLLSVVCRAAGILLLGAWWLSFFDLLPSTVAGYWPVGLWASIGFFGMGVALICVGAVARQYDSLREQIREQLEEGPHGSSSSH